MKLRLPLAAAVCGALLNFNARAATTHYVDVNCTNPISPYLSWVTAATNIQQAANIVSGGDTVLVTNGIYQYGGIPIGGSNRVYINNPVTVQSVNGPAVTVIKGYQVPGTTNGANAVRCVFLNNGATLSGFTLTNGATPNFDYGGGVKCASTNCLVTNCVIIGNASYDGGAGAYQGTLKSCVLTGNSAPPLNIGGGGGANGSVLINCLLADNFAGYVGGGAINSTLINCTVVSNVAAAYAGSIWGSTLQNCIVYYNSSYYTNTDTSAGYSFSNCCVSFSLTGISGVNNFTNPPLFADLSAGDYHLNAASPCINTGNYSYLTGNTDLDGNPRIIGGIVDIGAYEFQSPVHYVKTSVFGATPVSPFTNWITAATNIQDAIDASTTGDTVLVTNGVYATGGRQWYDSGTNRVTLTNAVTLQSVNGPAVTLIVGSHVAGTGPTLANAVRCVAMGNNAVLSGFTLTNGQAGWGNYPSGGGVANVVSVSAVGTVSNCVLIGNLATNSVGGGAFRVRLVNCKVVGNYASSGGGACSCTLDNCTVMSNTAASGGGVFGGSVYGASLLNNCTIIGNSASSSGGGAYGGTLNACSVSNNTAVNGGGAYGSVLCNSLIVGNSASSGGGLYGIIITNCTVAFNLATNSGGGINGGSGAWCYNSIIYCNSAPNGSNAIGTKFNNCCTIPNPYGGGITNEPLFANPATGDFHLQSYSPCINSGDNSFVTTATDLDGNPRIVSGTVDMGAYEFQSPGTVIFYANLQAPTNNSSGITLSWQSVNGLNYFIQRSADLSLQPAFTTIQSNIVGQAGTTSYTDTDAVGDGPYFYRVGVQ